MINLDDSLPSPQLQGSAELLVAELSSSAEPVEQSGTHISTVVFQGDWAYKVKRPVKFEFIDLSTPELRERMCKRELELNRRFAHDVYDSVVEIHNREGRVVDHALKMRRMPANRRLATLARQSDSSSDECVQRVARAAAVFHAQAPRRLDIDAVGEPEFVARLWQRSIDDLRRFSPEVIPSELVDEIDERARQFIVGRARLFAQRIDDHLIVDGHGDLLADDIFCLPDGPRILDCLEFDDRLRFGDVLLDVAFLAMDLEHLGRADLASTFISSYALHSGEHHHASLLHFYVAYRSLVRAKVACLKIADDANSKKPALSLSELTVRHLRNATVTLTIVGGLPAAGKTTVAGALADSQRALLLRSDVIRKEITGRSGTSARSAFGSGIYDSEITEATYNEIFRRARIALELGESVVVDASFNSQPWRTVAINLGFDTHTDLREIRCVCPRSVRTQRLAARTTDGAEPSDATVEISDEMERLADEWPEALEVDTDQPLTDSIAAIHAAEPTKPTNAVSWIRPDFGNPSSSTQEQRKQGIAP
jgi:uncharacterized protein